MITEEMVAYLKAKPRDDLLKALRLNEELAASARARAKRLRELVDEAEGAAAHLDEQAKFIRELLALAQAT